MVGANGRFAHHIKSLRLVLKMNGVIELRQFGSVHAGIEWQECREKCSGGGRIPQRAAPRQAATARAF